MDMLPSSKSVLTACSPRGGAGDWSPRSGVQLFICLAEEKLNYSQSCNGVGAAMRPHLEVFPVVRSFDSGAVAAVSFKDSFDPLSDFDELCFEFSTAPTQQRTCLA